MGFFGRAQNILINGGNFVQAHRYQVGFGAPAVIALLAIVCGGFYATSTPSTVSVRLNGENAAQLLRDYTIAGATHNSEERLGNDPPRCHEHTRVAFLASVRKQVTRSFRHAKSPPVIWIHGPAGIGKSAIAQTLAEGWEKDKRLAASFFFWRASAGRDNKKFVITTIAYQLAKSFPDMRPHLEKAVIDDPLFINQTLSAQVDMLITIPLENSYPLSRRTQVVHPKIIILDGLDEVLDEEGQLDAAGQRDILQAFVHIVTKRSLPLRLLVLSRPELAIREGFDDFDENLVSRWNMTQVEHDQDIQRFISSEFKSIQRKRPWLNRPDWPPQGAITDLTQRSSGRFIYSKVVMRYIESSDQPDDALRRTLSWEMPGRDQQGPYSTLDDMYRNIFSSLRPSTLEFANVLISTWIEGNWLIYSFAPLLSKFFALDWVRSEWELQNLHSVIQREDQIEDCKNCILGQTLQPIHASLLEFIQSQSRSGQFHLGPRLARSYVTFLLLGLQNRESHTTRTIKPTLGYGDWHLFMEIKDHLRKGVEPLPLLRNCLAGAQFEDVESYTDRILDVFDAPKQLNHLNMRRLVMQYLEDCRQEMTSAPPRHSGWMEHSINNFLMKFGILAKRSPVHSQLKVLASLGADERCTIGRPVINIERPEVDFCRIKIPVVLPPYLPFVLSSILPAHLLSILPTHLPSILPILPPQYGLPILPPPNTPFPPPNPAPILPPPNLPS